MKFLLIFHLLQAAFFFIIPLNSFGDTSNVQLTNNNIVSEKEKVELLNMISKNDENIRESLKDKEMTARAMSGISVRKHDLNGDGAQDIIVTIEGVGFCGASGNCTSWIYVKSENSFRYLGDIFGLDIVVNKNKTNGYSDIATKSHGSATLVGFDVYKYDGGKYKKKDCWTEEHKGNKVIKHKCDYQLN